MKHCVQVAFILANLSAINHICAQQSKNGDEESDFTVIVYPFSSGAKRFP